MKLPNEITHGKRLSEGRVSPRRETGLQSAAKSIINHRILPDWNILGQD